MGLNYGFNYGLPKTLKCFKEEFEANFGNRELLISREWREEKRE